MSGSSPRGVGERLSDRDWAILADVERFRLLGTGQIQRLHFTEHASRVAAIRACNRALARLRDLRLVAPLERRVGGVRRGSASYVWQLGAAGERVLRAAQGQARRRRFAEPGLQFVRHTLAVADVAVGAIEAARATAGLAIEQLGTEPGNWRSYLGPSGEVRWLKPDLHLVTSRDLGSDEYEETHSLLEIDLGTEHLPRIQAKCEIYAAYAATGAYQAAHGLFPAVIWLSPDPARRAALETAVRATRGLSAGVFQVTSAEDYLVTLVAPTEAISATPRTPIAGE